MESNFSHIFVAKHSIATEDEVQELLQKFKITKENLPLIKTEDPAAKLLNAKAGDVLKIERHSEVLNKETYYWRLVID